MEHSATDHFVGRSEAFLRAIHCIPRISRMDSPALICGESGTGKELCARAIHYMGHRAAKPFIPINCGGIPEPLFENELFGHVKGAYTGAGEMQQGLVGEAEGGTLFLDEINMLAPAQQVKLLRFIEDRRYKKLGSSRYLDADVRILSATNVNLEKEVRECRFREDLFYRINVLAVELPPLRERTGDVPLLARHFLDSYAARYKTDPMQFSAEALRVLELYPWPGNIRELMNVVEKAAVRSQSDVIGVDALAIIAPKQAPGIREQSFREAKHNVLCSFEKEFLTKLLEQCHGNISEAARTANKDRRTFQRLMKKHGISHAGSH